MPTYPSSQQNFQEPEAQNIFQDEIQDLFEGNTSQGNLEGQGPTSTWHGTQENRKATLIPVIEDAQESKDSSTCLETN